MLLSVGVDVIDVGEATNFIFETVLFVVIVVVALLLQMMMLSLFNCYCALFVASVVVIFVLLLYFVLQAESLTYAEIPRLNRN